MTRKPGYVAAGITGLVLSAGVGIPLALLSGLGGFQPRIPPPARDHTGSDSARICENGFPSETLDREEIITCAGGVPHSTPSIAEIVCEQDGTTRVLTPTVQPQRDGVHLRVDNRTGMEMELAVHGETQSHAASEYAPPGIVSLVSSIAPGRVGVGCVDWNDQPEPGPSADLTIVDPEGLWASPELDCGAPAGGGENEIMVVIHDHSFASPGKRGDPVELARHHFGWADSRDTVEPAGYPEADAEANGALVRIVRGGRVVATAGYHADGKGGWLLGSEWLCGGSDTAPAAWNPAGP